ncbi:translocation/assembly module TamB domain-containing protein [Paracoccus benzoatiresistens]|uniref:Translocation/assembly module TamB domain-containing protein n=1 Tax=Paracoccus benzoatiresistens TaxID=2997341 RepID=A0ABT4J2Q7_9RHOB|nr:translocation/assembly module TamB domain-containing protein [Paracoccus sp. EF6]MCZ0961366.1 translocation/assembly module TamB domain-containing protein [Paracoccus sp. EF6]
MRKLWLILFAILFPLSVMAQSAAEISQQESDDRGFLTRLLERNLSSAGREVVIDGFEGALSSRATFRRITIADGEGVWLTLNDGAIQWNRSALLRGRIEIAEMSAREILLPRLPQGERAAPTAEAREFEFALPELPVAININQIKAERVELGEPVIGLAAAISLGGGMSLEGGEGQAKLAIQRLDGPRGAFDLDAGYSNASQILRVNLALDEAEDGLLVNLIDLYDKPSVVAEISGEGQIKDFGVDIKLATDGLPRVTGRVSAAGAPDGAGSPGTRFNLQLGGDVASLLAPENRTFFGSDVQLLAEGWRGDDGRLEIPKLNLATEALTLDGDLAVNAQGAPQTANLLITLGSDAGAAQVPVALPFAGENSTVESGRLELQYDAAQGQGWTLAGQVGALDMGDVSLGDLRLDGSGAVVLDGGSLQSVNGGIRFGSRQMVFTDAGLAEAIGPEITGSTNFDFTPGNAVEFTDLSVNGSDYGLDGFLLLSGLGSGFVASADLDARYEDLARISTLAGRDMKGRADASVTGYYSFLTRGFDVDASVNGTDIAVDQPQVDRLLEGRSTIVLDARRDETGIEIGRLAVNAQRLTAEAQGYVNSLSSDVTATISMPSLQDADPNFSGGLQADAKLSGPAGQRQLTVSGEAEDLRIGVEALDNALEGTTTLTVLAAEKPQGYEVEVFRLANPQLRAEGRGSFAQGALDASLDLSVPDLAAIREGWTGGFDAMARLTEQDGTRFIDLTGSGQNLSFGVQNADAALTGMTRLRVSAEEKDGTVTLRDVQLTNDQINATAQGVYGPGVTDISADVSVASLASFGPGWRGALDVTGSFREAGDGIRRLEVAGTGRDLSFGQAQVDGALAGETRLAVTGTEKGGVFTIEQARIDNPRLTVTAAGTAGGDQTDVTAQVNAQDLRFLGNGISGALRADARLVQQGGTRRLTATGTADGLSVGQPRVDPLLAGQTGFDVAATQSQAGLSFQRLNVQNPQLQIQAEGDTASGMNVQARLADLGLLKPEFPGPVQANGTIREEGANFQVNLQATAPGSTQLQVTGSAARNFSTLDLGISGSSDASVANTFIRTRSIEGPLSFDLAINGAPSLQAVSGRVRLTDGQISDPGVGIRLEAVNATADLAGGRITLNADANVSNGGRVQVSGPVDLQGGTLDLAIVLDRVIARDPNLYQTEINGRLRMSGRNADGPLISGTIDLGETEIRIPSTGLGGAKAIPDINHVGDTRPVRSTRAKAGLEPYPSEASREAGLAGPPSTPPAAPPRLDLLINAPNQFFVRGRGVDAELGGSLQVQGTTRNAIPIGHLELIRGRVDLLGKRFDLTEGLVELQGSLIPVIRLVAETEQDGITTRIIIDGEVRDPEITFESSPELPEEEVLSQLLFGRGLANISPLQAAQLANAIAVLAGRGGEGIIGNLRNQVGLDDLDLATDDEGNVQVRAGKYLSDNVYTDVQVGADGKSSLNLNLDVTNSLTARGSVGSDGDSTLGIYFERDY